jgi:hypothetical protein
MFADIWAALLRGNSEQRGLSQEELEGLTERQMVLLYFREKVEALPEEIPDPTCEQDIIDWCHQARAGMQGLLCPGEEEFQEWIAESLRIWRLDHPVEEKAP